MTINPISLRDIEAYLNIAGIASRGLRLEYLTLILAMDDEYIAETREKSAEEAGADTRTGNRLKEGPARGR